MAAVADTAASVAANTTVTFDTITDFTSGSDTIVITAVNAVLAGGVAATGVTLTTLTTAAGSIADTTIDDFAELAAAIAAGPAVMVASDAGAAGPAIGLQAFLIDLTGNTGALGTGSFLVINDANANLQATDVMFALTGTSTAVLATDITIA